MFAVSPDQLVGRGLKHLGTAEIAAGLPVSPDQLVGRGLKPISPLEGIAKLAVSPDQLVGRGLKLIRAACGRSYRTYRPINWSGAD